MANKYQTTSLNQNLSNALIRLDEWVDNPWRRYSLLLIIFLIGFLLGSSVGMINGVLALMDPIGAFAIVIILELMVRLRRFLRQSHGSNIALQILDSARIGLLYGLFMEGFKLL